MPLNRLLAVVRAYLTDGADDAEVERWDKHHALTPEEQRKAGKLEDRSRNTGQVLEAMRMGRSQWQKDARGGPKHPRRAF